MGWKMKRRKITTAAFLAGVTTLAVSLPAAGGGRLAGLAGLEEFQARLAGGTALYAPDLGADEAQMQVPDDRVLIGH